MRPIFPAILFIGLAGCVALSALTNSDREIVNAQGAIVDGINYLDARCQQASHTEEELSACRVPRDKARDGLRRQLAAISTRGGAK